MHIISCMNTMINVLQTLLYIYTHRGVYLKWLYYSRINVCRLNCKFLFIKRVILLIYLRLTSLLFIKLN